MDEQKIEKALETIRQGHSEDGMNLLNEELIENPNNWRIHYHTGIAWRIIGDLPKAITSFQRSIQLCIDNRMNYYELGITYQLNGDLDNALQTLFKAHQLDKSSVEVLIGLALTIKKRGDIQKAIEVYSQATETLMSNIYEKLKEEGQNVNNKVPNDNPARLNHETECLFLVPEKLKQDPLYCTIQNNIGICYVDLGQYDEAEKAFIDAIEYTPISVDYQEPIIALRQLEEKKQ